MYNVVNEIHFGGAKAIGSCGLEFNDEDPKNLVEAFDLAYNERLNPNVVDPLSLEDVTQVTKILKRWLTANGVSNDVIQRVFSI